MKQRSMIPSVVAGYFSSVATVSASDGRLRTAIRGVVAAALVFVFAVPGATSVTAAWTYDFAVSGLDTNYWSTQNPYGAFTFSSALNGVTVAGGSGSFQTAKLNLNLAKFPPLTDFSMSVTFSNASLGGGVHQIQLETSWEGGGVLLDRSNQSSEGVPGGNSVNIWDGSTRNLTAVDAAGGTSSLGTFLLTRTGTTFCAYWNGGLFWSEAQSSSPLTSVNLAINNNYGATDPTAVTWQSFTLSPGLLQQPRIVAFGLNGQLVCTNLQPGTTARVEWASSLDGPWTNWASMVPLDAIIVSSNNTVNVSVPMFYRLHGTPSSE